MAAAAAAGAGGGGSREGTAKATVSDQIFQAIQSTSYLLQLMQLSSPSQTSLALALPSCMLVIAHCRVMDCRNLLSKLPKNLLAKASTIKNTEQVNIWLAMQGDNRDLLGNTHISRSSCGLFLNKVIEQMPRVISALDVHMESGLHSVPCLKMVIQLLSNMDSCQLNSNSAPHTHQIPQESELIKKFFEAERYSAIANSAFVKLACCIIWTAIFSTVSNNPISLFPLPKLGL